MLLLTLAVVALVLAVSIATARRSRRKRRSGSPSGSGGNDKGKLGERAEWLPAEATPFGVPVLDIAKVTGGLISTSKSQDEATMAISWGQKVVSDLDVSFEPIETFACELRYPAEEDLPEGWLFSPSAMEEKWVIGYREGQILLARSWTGEVKVAADAKFEGGELIVERVQVADEWLGAFGDPVQTFDWILRSHALGQFLPLPVSEDGARLLESVPLAAFGHYGSFARCAATSWSPAQPARPLRSTSSLVTAVRREDSSMIAALAAAGHSLNSRATVGGYTALHVAAIKQSTALTAQLLELGADPNVLADRQASVLITALVHQAPPEVLNLLASHGANLGGSNVDGFGPFHALAEVDNPEPVPWLASKGLDIELQTGNGHTPLQIAAALGHVSTLNALLLAGAKPSTRSRDGATAREVALAEGKSESVKALDEWQAIPDN
ncbi:MAG TPA: ankyrin repeat domain-containing protein [Polyangiaceae bacterium]|nr:ankyrin repeat domain-containing protein [Polyangiaceae bacterium]